jgi:hypothetical protein
VRVVLVFLEDCVDRRDVDRLEPGVGVVGTSRPERRSADSSRRSP